MTPEAEKAKEIYSKYEFVSIPNPDFARMIHKECAMIVVNEILLNIEATKFYHPDSKSLGFNQQYWEEVKQEIEKI